MARLDDLMIQNMQKIEKAYQAGHIRYVPELIQALENDPADPRAHAVLNYIVSAPSSGISAKIKSQATKIIDNLKRGMKPSADPINLDFIWMVFHHFVPKNFDSTGNPYSWRVAQKTSASFALRSLLDEKNLPCPVIFDCASAVQFAQELSILDLCADVAGSPDKGDEFFDACFGSKHFNVKDASRLVLAPDGAMVGLPGFFIREAADDYKPVLNPLRMLIIYRDPREKSRYASSDIFGFKNANTYLTKHPRSTSCNMNGVRDKKGLIHFLGCKTGKTDAELRQRLVEKFNVPQTDSDLLFASPETLKAANLTITASDVIGIVPETIFGFNEVAIHIFFQALNFSLTIGNVPEIAADVCHNLTHAIDTTVQLQFDIGSKLLLSEKHQSNEAGSSSSALSLATKVIATKSPTAIHSDKNPAADKPKDDFEAQYKEKFKKLGKGGLF